MLEVTATRSLGDGGDYFSEASGNGVTPNQEPEGDGALVKVTSRIIFW